MDTDAALNYFVSTRPNDDDPDSDWVIWAKCNVAATLDDLDI